MTVIQTPKELILEAIPKIRHEIRFEASAFLERRGFAHGPAQHIVDTMQVLPEKNALVKAMSEKDKERFNIMIALKKEIETISNELIEDSNPNIEAYQARLKTAIQTALLDPKVTKQYGCFKKLAITLLNIVTGITVVPALIKKCVTGTFFYSTQGKTKEAIDEMHTIEKSLTKKLAKK